MSLILRPTVPPPPDCPLPHRAAVWTAPVTSPCPKQTSRAPQSPRCWPHSQATPAVGMSVCLLRCQSRRHLCNCHPPFLCAALRPFEPSGHDIVPSTISCCRIGDRVPTIDYAEPSQKDQQGGGAGGGGGASGGMRNVFVGNLQPGASEETLRSLFAHYGEVGWCGRVAGGSSEAGLPCRRPPIAAGICLCATSPTHGEGPGLGRPRLLLLTWPPACSPAVPCRLSGCTSRGPRRVTPTPSLASSTSATAAPPAVQWRTTTSPRWMASRST